MYGNEATARVTKDVKVFYKDSSTGADLSPSQVLGNGMKVGDSVTTVSRTIPGYSFEGNSLVTPSSVTDSPDSQISTTLQAGERVSAADGTALDYAGFIAAGGLVDDSKLDTNTPGTYPVTYTLNSVTTTANITVKENKAEVNVHNSSVYVGDDWTAQDNFDSALDKDRNPVDFSKVTVDDSLADTSKAGTFDVTYTYDGVTSTATVTVLDKVSPKPTPEIPKDDGKNTDLPKASSNDSSSTSEKYVAHENNNKVSEHKSRKALPQTGSSNRVYLSLIGLAVLAGLVLTFSLKNKPRRK